MRKLIAVLTVLVLGVSSVALAATAKTKKVSIGGTFHSAVIGGANGIDVAGVGKDRRLGQVAIVFSNVGVGKAQHVPFTIYTKNGSFTGLAVADISADAAGNVTIANGTFTVSSGGGALKGVKGSGTFSGTGKINTSQTITYKGSLTEKK